MTIKHLGKSKTYNFETYDPGLLDSVPRNSLLQPGQSFGHDFWNAYEFSFLNLKSIPVLRAIEIKIPSSSSGTVESKSLKLYLASFYMQKFKDPAKPLLIIQQDLSALLNAKVVARFKKSYKTAPAAILLNTATEMISANKIIKFEGFRSICPITSQPDWANIYLHSKSSKLNAKKLMKLFVSFRQKGDFHEACIESIFMDIIEEMNVTNLTIYGKFLRRGGIDINPLRSTNKISPFTNHREFLQ